LGIRGRVSHSTLADANQNRDWRIYHDLAQTLIQRARLLYGKESIGMELDQTVYALDSTTIDLCLKLFPWARFRRAKAAVKLHTLLDLRGSIPVFISISDGKMADVRILDDLVLEVGAFYVMDRGYLDFQRLYRFVLASAFYVTRSKSNLKFNRVASRRVEEGLGIRSDQIVGLRNPSSLRDYPDKLRRIHFVDPETSQSLVFLTNNFELPALTVASLYKSRWQVELFFKWIKQNLRIKHFFGNSDNAVKTQIWISICVYVLVAIIKKELKLERSLSSILQILSINVFSKEPLAQLLTEVEPQFDAQAICNQLIFKY
jgi:IS4 transposase